MPTAMTTRSVSVSNSDIVYSPNNVLIIKDDFPGKELTVCKGNTMTFCQSLRSFEALVDNKRNDPGDRLCKT